MSPDKEDLGICTVALAPVRGEPSHLAEQTSQILFGETYRILDESPDGEWLHIQCELDEYQGWIPSWSGLVAGDPKQQAWREHATGRVGKYYEAVRMEPDPKAEVLVTLPWDARVIPVGEQSRWIEVELPDRDRGYLPKGSLGVGESPGGSATERKIIKTAARFLGVPYVWGGRSSWGLDCSGLIQLAFRWHGIQLPRDATQQMMHLRHLAATEGIQETETDPIKAKPGSLVFFGNEPNTASHVALATGGGEILHAQGWVRRASLDKSSELFETQLFSKLIAIHKAPV